MCLAMVGWALEEGRSGDDYKGTLGIFWGVMDMFIILTVAMGAYLYTFINTYQIINMCS